MLKLRELCYHFCYNWLVWEFLSQAADFGRSNKQLSLFIWNFRMSDSNSVWPGEHSVGAQTKPMAFYKFYLTIVMLVVKAPQTDQS
jgi:hypothetical protein